MKNDNMTFGGFESVISNLTDNTTVVKMSSDADADDDSKIVDPKEITGKEEDEDEDDFEDGEGGADGKKVEDTLPKTDPKTSKTQTNQTLKILDSVKLNLKLHLMFRKNYLISLALN